MATSLYDLSVPTFLQTVRAVAGFLQRAAKHCAETGADPDDFVHARLIADMAPFHFQIEALSHHSVWGLEAVKTGIFAPPALIGAMPFAGLRALIDEAIAALEALTPAEVNGWAGKALNIALYRPLDEDDRSSAWAPRQLAFTSETFLLSLRCPTFISTPSPPMTSCARGACRLASATMRADCALGWRSGCCSRARRRLVEGVGFEPTREREPPGGFQDRCLKPLGHPSHAAASEA